MLVSFVTINMILGSKDVYIKNYENMSISYGFYEGLLIEVLTNKKIKGISATLYAVDGNMKLHCVGVKASNNNIVTFNNLSWITSIYNSWSETTKTDLKDQEIGILAFLTIVTKDLVVYDVVKSIPLNYYTIKKENLGIKTQVELNLDKIRPTKIIDLNGLPSCNQCKGTNEHEVGENCIDLGCAGGICSCYCVKWVAPDDEYYHLSTYEPLPAVAAMLHYDAERVFSVSLHFAALHENCDFFASLMGANMITENTIENATQTIGYLHIWTLNDRWLQFGKDMTFFNSRWTDEGPQFYDEAILSLDIYARGGLGNFTKYEKYCERGFCDEIPYHATDTKAVIVLEDILVYDWYGTGWEVPSTYEIDDYPGDGNGFLDFYFQHLSYKWSGYHHDSEWIDDPDSEQFSFEELSWTFSENSFGIGADLLSLFGFYINIPSVFYGCDLGVFPLYFYASETHVFSSGMGLKITNSYSWAYVSSVDYKYRGTFLYDDYYIIIPIYTFDIYIY